ncbi:MAG: SUMF1/EgtB/PvdO family nonheme iron enzyme [Candidatus Brocadiaceae bacterium]|nr:SUMF1/EgtB/PvdO family nonheme iron enzyme [Candidatus Brocadiaceae bacterium]
MKKHYLIPLIFISLSCFLLTSVLFANKQTSEALKNTCKTCGKTYSKEVKYCGDDGTKLSGVSEKKVCPVCKQEGLLKENFCREHGKELIPYSETPSASEEEESVLQKKILATKYFREAEDYCNAESYDLAIQSYKKVEEIFPDYPELHHNMGWLYFKQKDIGNAIYHLQRYIILSPNASDITEVQGYLIKLQQAKKRKEDVLNAQNNRDKVMKAALEVQKEKYDSVLIPEGVFTMGSTSGREDAEHEHSVYLDEYEIDRYEVTNAQYWEFLHYMKETNDHSKCFNGEPSGKDHTPRFWENDYYDVPDFPVCRIDWFDAYAYAAWAGKRLPTEAEWEKAARGQDKRIFPWGNMPDPSRCDLSEEPKPVGSNENGKSIYGCYDMAGSVNEWCADWYSRSYYRKSPYKNPKGPESGIKRIIRGGSRFCKKEPSKLASFERKSKNPDMYNVDLGFRCVKEVKKETIKTLRQ